MFKQTITTLFLVTSLITFSSVIVQASNSDQFEYLRSLKINEIVSKDSILQHGGTLYSQENNKFIYTFPSSKSTNPHILYTSKDDNITFIQVTIPADQASSIASEFRSYGQPEATYEKTRDEILLAYPSRGYSLIVNGDISRPERLMYYPAKSVQEHARQEAINYTTNYQYAAPSIQPTSSLINPLFSLPTVLIVVSLLVLAITIFFIKRRPS